MSNSIKLRKITENEFNIWKEESIKSYAEDLLLAGQCTQENAIERANADFNNILTEGISTPNNFIYIAENMDKEAVGIIWYETNTDKRAFIADFLVYSNYRGKGYGKSILQELELVVKEQGIEKILLHVFEKNITARELYKKMGYIEVQAEDIEEGSIYMRKNLI